MSPSQKNLETNEKEENIFESEESEPKNPNLIGELEQSFSSELGINKEFTNKKNTPKNNTFSNFQTISSNRQKSSEKSSQPGSLQEIIMEEE